MDRRQRTITLRLTKRADGMWCKSIGGRIYYFGPKGCDEETARTELLQFLQLNRKPEVASNVTVREIANRYASACAVRIGDDLQIRTWKQYESCIQEFLNIVGSNKPVAEIARDDFAAVARKWRQGRGVHRTNNDIQSVRTMFRWAYENGIIDRTPVYGDIFAKVEPAQARVANLKREREHGQRRFGPEEIQAVLKFANDKQRAMFLLALNFGMYSVDVSDLKWSDIEGGFLNRIREKTGVAQNGSLWPETVEALGKLRRAGEYIFTTCHGNRWNNRKGVDSIGLMFRRLLKQIGIKRAGVGFGSCRHTHISAVNDHPDRSACRLVRGHVIEGIDAHYDFPSIERLNSVTDLARSRLIGKPASQVKKTTGAKSDKPVPRARGSASVGTHPAPRH